MLILLFCFSLFNLLSGAPAAVDAGLEPNHLITRDSPATPRFDHRKSISIIFSCLATIFACTWTSFHPNIPSLTDTTWDIYRQRGLVLVYALLAPEAITALALMQHAAAKDIAHRYNYLLREKGFTVKDVPTARERHVRWFPSWLNIWLYSRQLPPPLKPGEARQWTTAHGFFVQMGGFILCDNGEPVQTLQYSETSDWRRRDPTCTNRLVQYLIANGAIDPPTTSETEIKDRSKGDLVSKTVTVLQTSWFLAQCVARWAARLPVTELEVVTLGFAVLNCITYAVWLEKPQNVTVPVYLERKATVTLPVAARRRNEHSRTLTSRLMSELSSRVVTLRFTTVRQGDLGVHILYAATTQEDAPIWIASSGIAVLFGLVHFIPAWYLTFSTHVEMLLWKVFAGVITGVPLVVFIHLILKKINVKFWLNYFLAFYLVVLLPCYIIARIAVLVLAFASLRNLPPGALLTISWISLIPHL